MLFEKYRPSGVLGEYTRVYGVYQPPGCLTAYILTSVIINKQGTLRPFATPVCVYPPPFLAIHHCIGLFIFNDELISDVKKCKGNFASFCIH